MFRYHFFAEFAATHSVTLLDFFVEIEIILICAFYLNDDLMTCN